MWAMPWFKDEGFLKESIMSQLFDSVGDTGGDGRKPKIGVSPNDASAVEHGVAPLSIPVSNRNPVEGPSGIADYRDVPAFGLLQHAAEKLPNRDAVRYGDEVYSYEELNAAAIRCAAMFQRMGIRPGDRVGVLLPNVPEYIIACNGAWRAGAVVVAISPLMVQEEVERLLRATHCRTVVCLDLLTELCDNDSELVDQVLLVSIRKHLPAFKQLGYLWLRHRNTGLWKSPSNCVSRWFWDAMDEADNRWQPITIDPKIDSAYILPTGGTTGTPKAVTLSHTNLVANAWQQYVWTDRSFGTETMMAVLPFFHSYGMSATVMGGTAMGATLVLHHRYLSLIHI